MFLLDTNIVSELRRARPHGAVLAWLEAQEDADLYLSAVTLGEIQAGIEITRTQDPLRAAQIEAWADELASVWNILSADVAIFRLWAKLMHRQPDHLYRSEEHTSELQSLMRISYAVFCFKTKNNKPDDSHT